MQGAYPLINNMKIRFSFTTKNLRTSAGQGSKISLAYRTDKFFFEKYTDFSHYYHLKGIFLHDERDSFLQIYSDL